MLCPVCNKSFLDLRNSTPPRSSPETPPAPNYDHGDDDHRHDAFRNLFQVSIPPAAIVATGLDRPGGDSSPTWTVGARLSDCALRIAVQDTDFQGGVDDDDDFPTIVSFPMLDHDELGPSRLPALLFRANGELVADPALLSQSKRCDWSVFQLSQIIAQLVVHFQDRVCHHGVVLNQRVLATLVRDTAEEGCCALYNVIDLFRVIDLERVHKLGIVDEELFEVSADEYAMSAPDFLKLTSWETYHCRSTPMFRARQRWGHILFLSHRWKERGVPGDEDELRALQDAVRTYIAAALQRGATTTVKNFSSEHDFGVWVDYMMVPNDPDHADCGACRTHRHLCVAKMAAIPTIATTIALHPDERSRGWIMHELTMNTHANIQDIHGHPVDIDCPHGARINIMVQNRVHFTNGSDGGALRCSEFLRLGQLPRNWPSVTRQLLQEWQEAGVRDERDDGPAKDILFKYARTFHLPCHRLKRAMIVWPQLLARRGVPKDDVDDWVYISYKDRPHPTGATTIPFLDRDRPEANDFDWSSKAIFNFDLIEREIADQEEKIKSLGIRHDVAVATSALQRMQFVSMTMGLRAELLFGEGWLHWVHLSALTESLSSCKRAVRLYDGIAVIQPTSCSVSFRASATRSRTAAVITNKRRLLETISSLARDTKSSGVSTDQLRLALDCLVTAFDPLDPPQNNLSGYAPTWFDGTDDDKDDDDS